MNKPQIKKGMNTFVGCDVGEDRAGTLKGCEPYWSQYNELVRLGYLQSKPDENQKNRTWFSLTEKGKTHVARLESYYAGMF